MYAGTNVHAGARVRVHVRAGAHVRVHVCPSVLARVLARVQTHGTAICMVVRIEKGNPEPDLAMSGGSAVLLMVVSTEQWSNLSMQCNPWAYIMGYI